MLQICAGAILATPLSEYQKRLAQSVSALETLAQSDEGESEALRAARFNETLAAVRSAIPETETVEWGGTVFHVDNSWLHRGLEEFEKTAPAEQANSLRHITERLQAVTQRLDEIERARIAAAANKAEARQKLGEILQRQEYARNRPNESALARLWRKLVKWIQNLFPKAKPLAPGSANFLTQLAQLLVILLALGVIAYAVKLFAPRLFKGSRAKKDHKRGPRIVLGEKLEPDQSAMDLLAEAEALAHRGELRAAIRKAYIALLVELGERKIISLAQHKTNRDYLSAVRGREPLYGHVRQLTDSFERHWYGLASASKADWDAFRAGYGQALTI